MSIRIGSTTVITDTRKGIFTVVTTKATTSALIGLLSRIEGSTVYNTDTGRLSTWNSSAWV